MKPSLGSPKTDFSFLIVGVLVFVLTFGTYLVSIKINKHIKISSYSATSIDEPLNKTTKLVLTGQGVDSVINHEPYNQSPDGSVTKGIFYNFIFSPDRKFLFYAALDNTGYINQFLYDIDKRLNTYFNFKISDQNFTKNSKYFYACGQDIVIYHLPDLVEVYKSTDKNTFFTCKPNTIGSEIIFSEFKDKNDTKSENTYSFFLKSGIFKKIN